MIHQKLKECCDSKPKADNFTHELLDMFNLAYDKSHVHSLDPSKLIELSKKHFKIGEQQDCHEFLLILLNSLFEEENSFKELFETEIRRTMVCRHCSTSSE